MLAQKLFKRRQILAVGVISLLSGGAVTAGILNKTSSVSVRHCIEASPTLLTPLIQGHQTQGDEIYINPYGFNQQFLTKAADIKQIWDFATIEQVLSDGFIPITNAMNAFQFVYKKSLYPLICLRGEAVIYALDDVMWEKYSLNSYGYQNGINTDIHPLYQRFTSDNGKLSPQNPNSLYQDSSLQALLLRGASIAACHDALNGVASRLAIQNGLATQIVFKELNAHLIPGVQQTPSCSSLIAVAQHFGFTYAKQ